MAEIKLWERPKHLSTQENWGYIAKTAIEWGQRNPGKDFELTTRPESVFLTYESLEDLKAEEEILTNKLDALRRRILDYDSN